MTSSNTSSGVRSILPDRSGGTSPEFPETSSSGTSSGAPSVMDLKALREVEVMKSCHDFSSVVTRFATSGWHKSRHDEGGPWLHSKGKEPATSGVKSDQPIFHRPTSMKELFGTSVRKDDKGYYALYMSDLAPQDPDGELRARWGALKNSTRVWDDPLAAAEFERGVLHPQLARELYMLPSEVLLARAAKEMVWNHHYQMALFDRVHDTGRLITIMGYQISNLQQVIEALKSGGGPEAVVAAEQRSADLEKEMESLKATYDEAIQRLEASDKDLNKVRGDLLEAQKQLKEQRARGRKVDNDLLKAIKELEAQRVELPKRAVEDYKGTTGFKLGLQRIGRVSYEYGYRVALARFRALHPDSKVEEDPFTVRPEDDSVPMELQQPFDDSISSKS